MTTPMTTPSAVDLEALLDEEHLPVFRAIPPRAIDPKDIEGSVAAIRTAGAARAAAAPPVAIPPDVAVEDRHVPGPAGAPDVRVRLYRPASGRPGGSALYWIHGGGMIGGSVDQSDAYCARVALETGALVASVDYRLAPEYPYPAPLEDCYAGLSWLAGAAGELGVDSSRLAVGGGSAGAGLAAGLALLARDRGGPPICYQHLVYPMLDDRNITRSSHAIVDTRVWCRDTNAVGWNAYLAGRAGQDGVEPYAAPARATDLAGLPPAYICVGTLDLFLDEDIAYAQSLIAAGVPVELHVYPGAYHGSVNTVPDSALSRRWRADESAALARVLGG